MNMVVHKSILFLVFLHDYQLKSLHLLISFALLGYERKHSLMIILIARASPLTVHSSFSCLDEH